ncbi:hypothetical protein RJ640_020012 [Escallonia rubra]|uniref:Uncharacterized protein n=1 Tax=Escallonia rubra TaxID=112253 RepID=A0AA88RDB4_9ASTE|nr:hypothetical protein RJ640_020012 [Escallonia rubra]
MQLFTAAGKSDGPKPKPKPRPRDRGACGGSWVNLVLPPYKTWRKNIEQRGETGGTAELACAIRNCRGNSVLLGRKTPIVVANILHGSRSLENASGYGIMALPGTLHPTDIFKNTTMSKTSVTGLQKGLRLIKKDKNYLRPGAVVVVIYVLPLDEEEELSQSNFFAKIVEEIGSIFTGTQIVLYDSRIFKQMNIFFRVNESIHEVGIRRDMPLLDISTTLLESNEVPQEGLRGVKNA